MAHQQGTCHSQIIFLMHFKPELVAIQMWHLKAVQKNLLSGYRIITMMPKVLFVRTNSQKMRLIFALRTSLQNLSALTREQHTVISMDKIRQDLVDSMHSPHTTLVNYLPGCF